ncbi:MAG: dihydropteroate synthase [Verrucomicrobia bacterium]|nr:dihydropteroate synthase [Cytophagales bacterium]
MGVLNLTPDSFFSGSRFTELNKITDKAGQMLAQGAAFIDVGGYSSRPGAENISENEETDRVLPVIESLVKDFADINISIDTFRARVAEKAVSAGAVMVNDISGGSLDEKMFETVAHLQVPYVLMHLRGNPQTMTQLTDYQDLLKEIFIYFEEKIVILKEFGMKDVVLDLGFGFAKNITQNFTLLQNLHYFDLLGLPMLIGISRKSLIYKTLGVSPEEALNGTTVLNTVALWQGANILRVHDVKEAIETVKLINRLQNA